MEERKYCQKLVQSDTQASLTMEGESWTRTYFGECLGEKCAAYEGQNGFCRLFQSTVNLPKSDKNTL